MIELPSSITDALNAAKPASECRTPLGAVLAHRPCWRHCTACEGVDHHWLDECDEHGEPLMVCKHCEAWREMTDADFEM